MSDKEFEQTTFKKGMKCIYNGEEHIILGVDFEFNLLHIHNKCCFWKHCKHVELVK